MRGIQPEIRVPVRLVGRIKAREVLDLPCTSARVETIGIVRFANLDRRFVEDLDELALAHHPATHVNSPSLMAPEGRVHPIVYRIHDFCERGGDVKLLESVMKRRPHLRK